MKFNQRVWTVSTTRSSVVIYKPSRVDLSEVLAENFYASHTKIGNSGKYMILARQWD